VIGVQHLPKPDRSAQGWVSAAARSGPDAAVARSGTVCPVRRIFLIAFVLAAPASAQADVIREPRRPVHFGEEPPLPPPPPEKDPLPAAMTAIAGLVGLLALLGASRASGRHAVAG